MTTPESIAGDIDNYISGWRQRRAQDDATVDFIEADLTAKLESLPPPEPSFVLGLTEPDLTNTGTYDAAPTIHPGGMLGPGFYADTIFDGWVNRASGVAFFENCTFLGAPFSTTYSPRPLVKHYSTDPTLHSTFSRCTFAPQHLPSVSSDPLDGIKGHDFTLIRCQGHHLDDFFNTNLDAADDQTRPINVTVDGCYAHSFHHNQIAHHPDGSHHDGGQINNGGRNINVRGTRIDSFRAVDGLPAMSCLMFSPMGTGTTLRDVLVWRNWFRGGQVALNFGQWTPDRATNIRILSNMIASQPALAATSVLRSTLIWNDNVDAAGQPVGV